MNLGNKILKPHQRFVVGPPGRKVSSSCISPVPLKPWLRPWSQPIPSPSPAQSQLQLIRTPEFPVEHSSSPAQVRSSAPAQSHPGADPDAARPVYRSRHHVISTADGPRRRAMRAPLADPLVLRGGGGKEGAPS